jgi:hypothetical protein
VGLLVSCAQTAKLAASRQPTETANAIVLWVTVKLNPTLIGNWFLRARMYSALRG